VEQLAPRTEHFEIRKTLDRFLDAVATLINVAGVHPLFPCDPLRSSAGGNSETRTRRQLVERIGCRGTLMKEFLSMSGYGAYVWSCYGITAIVLIGNLWSARRDRISALLHAQRRAEARRGENA
jgi:heme exporter protein D